MKTSHTVIIGDSREMQKISVESIHLVITSPPYWNIIDYQHNNQIGFNSSYKKYILDLEMVWDKCFQILYPGCRMCINIGDQFLRAKDYGRHTIIPIRVDIIQSCLSIGFDYMGAIIWQKITNCNPSGGATIMGSFPYPRNGIVKIDYEFILLFKKPGVVPKVSKEIKEKSKLTIEEWKTYFSGHWKFPGVKQDKHPAMFPIELPIRLIKMFSFVDDTILDPFLGSGTTALASKQLQRNSVGYEINKDYLSIIEEKLGIKSNNLFQDINYTIIL